MFEFFLPSFFLLRMVVDDDDNGRKSYERSLRP